jgi:NitT/TauT family transport system substrate-binding protein
VTMMAGTEQAEQIARGTIDFSLNFAAPLIIPLDAGGPITVLAGVHVGCFELLAHDGIRGIADLMGRSVGVQGLGSGPHVFLAAMASYVGLDPLNDINWVTDQKLRPKDLFIEGKIDALHRWGTERTLGSMGARSSE